MKNFAALFKNLDGTNKTSAKIRHLEEYFKSTPAEDCAWALYLLGGQKIKRLLGPRMLALIAQKYAGIPDWLFEECYETVGDLAETIALVLPQCETSINYRLSEVLGNLLKISQHGSESNPEIHIFDFWKQSASLERFLFNKVITGGFRVGVSRQLVSKAISNSFQIPVEVIQQRLMGSWEPTEEFFHQLTSKESTQDDSSKPLPFCLAHPLQEDCSNLGDHSNWIAEWKWDGIRAQFVRDQNQLLIWSRGEELLTENFPDLVRPAMSLPENTILDGEILPWDGTKILRFQDLQKRINRKNPSGKFLDQNKACYVAFDVLRLKNQDLTNTPLKTRKEILFELLPKGNQHIISVAESLHHDSWEKLKLLRNQSRTLGVEGLMLKDMEGKYTQGRVTGNWWKWKVEPYSVDAVLVYAQSGHGRRASLYSDYTFAVWDNENLVPFAKAYSGLTDSEISKVDKFIRQNTLEKFGPVRSVKPELVFEIAFENIQISKRHKCGVAVRFPRIIKWRTDKKPCDADKLEHLKSLIHEKQPYTEASI